MAKRLVVVGVDCSPASDSTLEWALESAARRGSRIDVVHAWTWGPVTSEFMVPDAPEQLAESARTAVTGQVEVVADDAAEEDLLEGDPGRGVEPAAVDEQQPDRPTSPGHDDQAPSSLGAR